VRIDTLSKVKVLKTSEKLRADISQHISKSEKCWIISNSPLLVLSLPPNNMPANCSCNLFFSVPCGLGYAAYLDQSKDIIFTRLDQLHSDCWDVVPFNLPHYPSHNNIRRSLMNFNH
jgi:hypothetical protein